MCSNEQPLRAAARTKTNNEDIQRYDITNKLLVYLSIIVINKTSV